MTVFLIREEERAKIALAITRARANVMPWDVGRNVMIDTPGHAINLEDRKQYTSELRGKYAAQRVAFPGGVEAAISFEEQPAGIIRHLSVSTPSARLGKVMNPAMLLFIAREFGFAEIPPRHGRVWVEEYEAGCFAINIAQVDEERPTQGGVQ